MAIMAYLCLATQDLPTTNLSSTSYFVACTLNATTIASNFSMQDGRITLATSLPLDNDLKSWTIWLPGPITTLTQEASIFSPSILLY